MDGMRGLVLFTIDGHKSNTERTHSENQWRILRVLARQSLTVGCVTSDRGHTRKNFSMVQMDPNNLKVSVENPYSFNCRRTLRTYVLDASLYLRVIRFHLPPAIRVNRSVSFCAQMSPVLRTCKPNQRRALVGRARVGGGDLPV